MTVPPRVAKARGRGFLIVTLVAFAGFVALLLTIRARPRFEREVVLTVTVQRVRHPLLSRLMNFISWFGFRPQSLLLPATAVAGTWLVGLRREARYLIFAWVASLMSFSTKLVIRRPRPSGNGIRVTKADLRDTSFPSGHTLHYVCFWGFFAYLCYTYIRNGIARRLSVSFIGSMIAAVGGSRVYLGHHWLTDVLGSYSLGIGYLSALVGLHRRHLGDG
jgi:undecaprenyl-diphosphatase